LAIPSITKLKELMSTIHFDKIYEYDELFAAELDNLLADVNEGDILDCI